VGVAVRVTVDPVAKLALQVLPQLIPAGLLVTVPEPVPASVTLSDGCADKLKVAVTDVFFVRDTVQPAVPLQAPPQPEKLDPDAGLAVRVIFVPELKFAVQVFPQLMPDGLLLTLPVPDPESCTVS